MTETEKYAGCIPEIAQELTNHGFPEAIVNNVIVCVIDYFPTRGYYVCDVVNFCEPVWVPHAKLHKADLGQIAKNAGNNLFGVIESIRAMANKDIVTFTLTCGNSVSQFKMKMPNVTLLILLLGEMLFNFYH